MNKELNDEYLGTVIWNKDPMYSGRCKIRVMNLMDGIPDELLPWATPRKTLVFGTEGAGALSVPKEGTVVNVRFVNGDMMSPEYYSIQSVDPDLVDFLKDDYENSHVLLYDKGQDVIIAYKPSTGLIIQSKGTGFQVSNTGNVNVNKSSGTRINITEDTISIDADSTVKFGTLDTSSTTLEGKKININANDVIYMSGNMPDEVAVNGNALYKTLIALAKTIDMKLPNSPGAAEGIVKIAKASLLNTKIKYKK